MGAFKRPHFEKYRRARRRRRPLQYPYSATMCRKFDAIELYPLDGGGFFFTSEHIGGTDTKRWLRALRSGDLLGPWKRSPRKGTGPDNIDWLAVYDDNKPPGYLYQPLEQHVWMNRLYFLLPLAQQYLRTGRKKWAMEWFGYFKSWCDAFPEPKVPLEDLGPGTHRVLRDMQVVWRMLVMIHSVFMMGSRGNALEPGQWVEIYRQIERHARTVYKEGRRQIVRGGGKNHFLQKGTALVYVGTLFPEMQDAGKWVDLGRRIVRWYMLRHTHRDGGSAEGCPTYSHFIARLYLDAYLLLKDNRLPQIRDIEPCVASQYAFLADTATPAWRTLQWGDSYSLDVKRDLEAVRKVFPVRLPSRKHSVVFPHTRVAVLRSPRSAVYIDAIAGGLWHIHRGKPHLEVFHRGKPVLIDSGCVNYDHEAEREGYLKSRAAHNTLVVEPVEKDEWPGKDTFYELGELDENAHSVTAACTYRGAGAKYRWTRKVSLEGDRLEILDTVTSRKPIRCALHFHPADGRVGRRKDGVTAQGSGWKLSCRCENGSGKALAPTVERKLAIDHRNERFQAADVSFSQRGRRVVFRTVCELSAR